MREQDQAVLHEILGRGEGFGHRQHVELAWRLLAGHASVDAAADAMAAAIRQVAAAHGQPAKYHETITRAWAHCVAVHQQRWPGGTFAQFAERNPRLLDSALLDHFYSPGQLRSAAARTSWVEPDRHPLPVLA
jgi:phage gp16-like protein